MISFENRRLARAASAELRVIFDGDWSRDDERALAAWYQELDDELGPPAELRLNSLNAPASARTITGGHGLDGISGPHSALQPHACSAPRVK